MKINSRKINKGYLPFKVNDVNAVIDPNTFDAKAIVKIIIPWAALELAMGNGNKIDVTMVKKFLETHLKIEK
jgi:hypothetical protein